MGGATCSPPSNLTFENCQMLYISCVFATVDAIISIFWLTMISCVIFERSAAEEKALHEIIFGINSW